MNAVDDTSVRLHSDIQLYDVNPQAWVKIKDQITLREAVIALLIFINGHLSFNNANQVVVTAAYPGGASYLYPKSLERRFESESKGSQIANVQGLYRQFRQVNETVLEELSILLNNEDINITENSSSLSGALSKTLCYTNRICQDDSRMKSRVLILSVDGNLSSQYIPIMNSIFASQKMKIPIDVCKIGVDTEFLEQASESTGGIYINIKHPKGLIQYLMAAFNIDLELRSHLNLGTQMDVDFRAACFLSGKVINTGYVCSVCLCIMSTIPSDGRCPLCDTEFDEAGLVNLKKKPVVVVKKKKKKRKIDNAIDKSAPGTPINM